MLVKVTFVKIALHYIVLFGRIEPQLAAAKAVAFIIEKLIERHYHVIAGKIRCDMVRIRYANVGVVLVAMLVITSLYILP